MRSFRRLVALTAVGIGLLAAANPAGAQGLGARGGVNFSNIVFDDPDLLATEARADFLAGGFATFRREAAIGLQIEAQVARRTVRFEPTIDDTMTYLEVPVLVRVGVYRGDRLVIHGLGGVSANYLISATESVAGADPDDIAPAIEPWDVALVIGADAQVRRRWIIGARFFYGLLQVYREHGDFPARQQGFQVTAGYRFR